METQDGQGYGRADPVPGKQWLIVVGLLIAISLCTVAVMVAAGRPGTCRAAEAPCRVCEPCGHCRPEGQPAAGSSSCGSSWPGGPITRDQTIEIATQLSAANAPLMPSATAGYDERLGRWVWHVSWAYSAGPTSGEFCDVFVDYFTGQILDHACAVA